MRWCPARLENALCENVPETLPLLVPRDWTAYFAMDACVHPEAAHMTRVYHVVVTEPKQLRNACLVMCPNGDAAAAAAHPRLLAEPFRSSEMWLRRNGWSAM